MEQVNFHKQKLYSLIIAGIALISMLLPWASISLGILGGQSVNGFRSWGFLTLLGVIGVAAACFLGDRSTPFDETFKKVAMGSFGAIALGALLFFLLTLNSGTYGIVDVNSGIGLWLSLIAGVLGIVWILGKIKLPDPK